MKHVFIHDTFLKENPTGQLASFNNDFLILTRRCKNVLQSIVQGLWLCDTVGESQCEVWTSWPQMSLKPPTHLEPSWR